MNNETEILNEEDLLKNVLACVSEPTGERSQSQDPASLQQAKPDAMMWDIGGIGASTKVSTEFGDVPAHLVRARDKLRTHDGHFRPVIKVHSYKLDADFLARHPVARPVIIGQRSLGRRLPLNAIEVSPAQKVVEPNDWSKRTCVRADTLTSFRSRFEPSKSLVIYFLFEFQVPTFFQCGGLWVESAA